MTCYDSDEANPRSVSSLSNRSSPLSWRYSQSSPRLQAGDAPSVGGGCRSEGTPSWYMHGERAHYSHTMPMRSPSKLSHISRLELVESLDADDVDLKSGYMSDSDLMGKTMTEDDDITTGWVQESSFHAFSYLWIENMVREGFCIFCLCLSGVSSTCCPSLIQLSHFLPNWLEMILPSAWFSCALQRKPVEKVSEAGWTGQWEKGKQKWVTGNVTRKPNLVSKVDSWAIKKRQKVSS